MVNEQLGTDLKLIDDDITFDAQNSFVFISDEDNLSQAIYSYLSTKLNEMELNENYGGTLYEVLGSPKTDLTLIHARLSTEEVLLKMPRIQEIVSVIPSWDNVEDQQINISISVIPIDQIEPLNLVYPLFI